MTSRTLSTSPGQLKAIETVYNGYRFRSRLEARWAVFFDAADIGYQYEPEGYQLSNGVWYLPDFLLPTFGHKGMFVEVKPMGGDFDNAEQLAWDTKRSVWLAEGPPDYRSYWVASVDECSGGCDKEKAEYKARYLYKWDGIPNFDQADGENRMFACPGYLHDDMTIPDDYLDGYSTFEIAVAASRAARFERGESG